MAIDEVADAGIFFTDFYERANVSRSAYDDIAGASILVDRDVDVYSDDGLSVTKSTHIHFRKDEVLSGGGAVRLTEGDVVTLLDSDEVETSESYRLNHVVSEDIAIVTWRAR